MKIIASPTSSEIEEYTAQTPKINPLGLHTARSNLITPFDFASTAAASS